MGLGQYIQKTAMDFDSMVKRQAAARADNARARAIADIKADMIENPGEPAYTAYYGAPGAGVNKSQQTAMAQPGRGEKYGDQYGAAATAYRTEQGMGPIEGLNRAMAENPYARYGVAGTAAVGGGLAMTAGAQKLMQLMGALDEATQTDVARDMPLQS